VKPDGSVYRVLFVEEEGLSQPRIDGLLNLSPQTQFVRAGSLREARRLLESQSFDVVVADESRLRRVIDSIFTFVGLFSLGGVVLDVNQAPLTVSGLRRDQVVGHRFIDMGWFAGSATERSRIAEAIASAANGVPFRMETWIRTTKGVPMCVDAAFAPLRDQNNVITHVIGSGVDITGRKRAEEALAGSQARLAEAQRVAHVGSWEWIIVDNRVSWSDELFRIYGIEPAEFVASYEGFLSRVDPDDREHTIAVIRRAIDDVTPFIYEHRIRRPDGGVRMLHTRGEVLPGADGKAARLVGSCWDITDRWQATQALEHTVSTLQATLEATADGILVGDRQGRVAVLNQRFLALWRLPSDVGPGTDIRELADRVRDQLVDPDEFVSKVAELYGDLEKESHDILRFTDGRVYERYSKPQRMGDSICGRVCSFRDVTQRERLFAAAEARGAEAEAARRQYQTILERISDGFVALDRSWRYSYVNGGAGRMLGRNAADLVGKHIWTEFPEGREQPFHRAYEQAMAEQRPVQLRAYYPPWSRWYENRIYPSPEGISIFFTDVSREVEAQQELRATNEQLRALAARLDAVREEERRVIAREVHDQIGQGLTALKLDVDWLRSQALAGGSAAFEQRAQSANALIDQIIETARRVSASLRPVILDDLGLAAAIRSQARDFEQRTGVACDLDLPSNGPAIAPPIALSMFRIVQEALTNVARHARAHQVHIGLDVGADTALLTVADDGRGVTVEELGRPSSLGIVGIRERVLAVGGEVTITGSPERGTTLRVRVPTAPGPAS
jgi:PAS domain S-box-containing protein